MSAPTKLTVLQRIHAGPWRTEENIIGQRCQMCEKRIWGKGVVRVGDELSPALYRHQECNKGKR